MLKFIVDENLPYYFSLWKTNEFIHVFDLPDLRADQEIWEYAKSENLIIITKDADFSNRIILYASPPKVIHLKIGNMKISELHQFLNKIWPEIINEIDQHKLVNVYKDRIESFE